MPIHCPFEFPRQSEEEMRTVDFTVMRHAFDTHNELGRLCDESVYQLELVRRLRLAGYEVSMEVPIRLSFREFSIGRSLDLVIANRVIYELKAVSELMKSHEGQLLDYLYLTNSTFPRYRVGRDDVPQVDSRKQSRVSKADHGQSAQAVAMGQCLSPPSHRSDNCSRQEDFTTGR